MFPKKGKVFLGVCAKERSDVTYASAMAAALRSELGDTHQAIKTLMKWTRANERTVKNWIAGTNGPSGEHLLALVRHSDSALETFLNLAGRERVLTADKLGETRARLFDLLALLDLVIGGSPK